MQTKKNYNVIFLLLFLFTQTYLKSQAFLNGSFETNTAAACDYNMSNASFNTKMSNCTAFGLGGELDIMQSTCPYGPSQAGTWFVALACPSGNTDAFTMTLSAPLASGITYTMSFWDKGDIVCCAPGMPVIIGVSTVAGAAGTTVYTGPTPTGGVWTRRCFSFVAPNNGQYISVRTAGPTRWTHIDNFSLSSGCVVLPIELMKLEAVCSLDNVQIKWSKASEKNNEYFAIEYSADGKNFVEIGEVPGAGNSSKQLNYEFTDTQEQTGTAYYRLKQTDFDRASTYSEIIAVQNCKIKGNKDIQMYPNPAENELLIKTSVEGMKAGIYSVIGTLMQEIYLTPGENNIEINNFPNGTYFVQFGSADSNPITRKLIINR